MLAAGGCFTFDEFAIFRAAGIPTIDHKVGFEASVDGLDDAAIGGVDYKHLLCSTAFVPAV